MLLELVLETHAWAAARVKHESNAAIQRYEKRISDLMDTEKEQGAYFVSTIASHLLTLAHRDYA